jgi:MraZ protein
MLVGKSFHTLDDKDRLVIPSKFRSSFDREGQCECITARGNGPFLIMHTMESWMALEKKLEGIPTTDDGALFYRMKIWSEAEHCTLDKQGRIVLSQGHKIYASIDKDVVLIGMKDAVWLWSKAMWEKKEAEHESHFEEYAKQWGV